jgi:hypothetical protein
VPNIVYDNIDNLPAVTRTQQYINTQNNTKVLAGQNVSLKSPLIKLLPGTKIEYGSTFKAEPEECNFLNFRDEVTPQFIGSNAIDNYQIVKCIEPNYYINATGVTEYTFQIYNLLDQLIHTGTGVPTSNQIFLWNANNASEGWYSVHVELSNCTNDEPLINDYNVLVLDCRTASQNDSFTTTALKTEKNTLNSVKDELDSKNELILYPNPASEFLNVYYSVNENARFKFSIFDISGKEVSSTFYNANAGSNYTVIDIENLQSGVYYLVAETTGIVMRDKFIVSK